MKIILNGFAPHYENGFAEFAEFHKLDTYDLTVEASIGGDTIKVEKNGKTARVTVAKPYQLFRALVHLKAHAHDEKFALEEPVHFDTAGTMFDGAQANSQMSVQSVKKMLLMLAGMGYNMMMLYCEDTYEIEGEPYFGHMRTRYTVKEFREIDDYAYNLGIEMIPCIQVLGHLPELLKKAAYQDIADTKTVMLVGEEKTYALIEKMILTMKKAFRSNRIHVGMDEAVDLGFGSYFTKHGYRPAPEIMREHMARVDAILKKHEMYPMMWGDMFFRAKSKNPRDSYRDLSIVLDEEDRKSVPENMSLIYWDYYTTDPEFFGAMLDKTKYLTDRVIWASCARNVRTFGAHYTRSEETTMVGMQVCKQKGVRAFFACVWGDDGRESSTFAVLPSLQMTAELVYGDAAPRSLVAERLFATTNLSWEALIAIDALDSVPGVTGENRENISVSRAIMWPDVLLGLMDADLGDYDYYPHYDMLQASFEKSANTYPEFALMFAYYAALCKVLKVKANIGQKLYAAYQAGDRETLTKMRDEILPQLLEDAHALRRAHRAHYFDEYKPIGWEVIDIRHGGVAARLDTAIARLDDYLAGRIAGIEELEEERLSFSGTGKIKQSLEYLKLCTASNLGRMGY